MNKTLKEISEYLNRDYIGNSDSIITGVAGIKEAGKDQITFLANAKYQKYIKQTKASSILLPPNINPEKYSDDLNIVISDNTYLDYSKLIHFFFKDRLIQPDPGIHKTAIIHNETDIGENVHIGPYVIIEKDVKIGKNAVIMAHSYIGQGTKIGDDTFIYPNVTIREYIEIGMRNIIHSGTVIGSDGFGFLNLNGKHNKILQLGNVIIGNDVEIGSNVSIDRATTDSTIIGDGTKIDNIVQIAHNVHIGKNCIICGQVGLSGSVTVEDNVTLAGQVGISGHLTIGSNTTIAAQSGVTKNIPANSIVSGMPAKNHNETLFNQALVRRIPKMYDLFKKVKTKFGDNM